MGVILPGAVMKNLQFHAPGSSRILGYVWNSPYLYFSQNFGVLKGLISFLNSIRNYPCFYFWILWCYEWSDFHIFQFLWFIHDLLRLPSLYCTMSMCIWTEHCKNAFLMFLYFCGAFYHCIGMYLDICKALCTNSVNAITHNDYLKQFFF